MEKKIDYADLLIKWYEKQKKEGKIKEPTEEELKRNKEFVDKLIEWSRKHEEKKEKVNILIEEWPVVELARICYKSSGISLYLPKRISRALKLDKDTNKTLVIMADGSDSVLLMKDTKVAEMLKPLVLDMRKALSSKLNKLP